MIKRGATEFSKMRRHGWELPYHPLQVVAIAVFLALAFAFYVFFVPFVGRKDFEYSVTGFFSFLVVSVFSLYIWCAASDPADPAVLTSKKYCRTSEFRRALSFKDSLPGPGSANGANTESLGEKTHSDGSFVTVIPINESVNQVKKESGSRILLSSCIILFAWFPLVHKLKSLCGSKASLERQTCEDDMLYCSLCEVEIFKYSKHCRVCDKCVDGFDHHCRWINNCIGRKNYKEFFVLMVSALFLLILQWSTGLFVLVRCFLDRNHFHAEIMSKLGSSFSLGPFIVVLGSCTILAMVATLPLGQLFFFHILLIKKGVSTYDYIVAMREQEQQNMDEGTQSPQMSHASSISAFSGPSSINALQHGSWCNPPQLFVENAVLPPDNIKSSIKGGNGSINRTPSERMVQKNKRPVKLSPWALARMNAEEVSRVAAQARKKSKVLRPISKQEGMIVIETDSSLESSSRDLSTEIKYLADNKRRIYKRGRTQSSINNFPFARSLKSTKVSSESGNKSNFNGNDDLMDINQPIIEGSVGLAPLQLEARSAFRSSLAMSTSGLIPSSAESSLASPDLQHFRESISSQQDISTLSAAPSCIITKGPKLQRSTSDGYEASGGESADDSDRSSTRFHKPPWNKLLFNSAYMGKKKTAKPLPYRTSLLPYSASKLKTAGQTAERRMQAITGKGVMRDIPEGIDHPIEEINSSPSQFDSPERDSDIFNVKESGLENSSRKGMKSTTCANAVPSVQGSLNLKVISPTQRLQNQK